MIAPAPLQFGAVVGIKLKRKKRRPRKPTMILQRPSPPSSLAAPIIKPHSFSKPSVQPIPSPSTSSNSSRRGILFLAAGAKTRASRVSSGRRRWTAKPWLVPLGAASNPPAEAAASDGDEGSGSGSSLSFRQLVVRVGEALSMAFPLWVGSACILALWRPSSFLWVHRNWQISGITLTMLGLPYFPYLSFFFC